jgi:2'-5' RNA ligase
MNSAARYAIYIAPPPDTPLWAFGSRVLGHDAASGNDVSGFGLPGMAPETWSAMTRRARQYGFHATLKAPFRLADGQGEEALSEAAAMLAADIPAFRLGALAATSISSPGQGGFVALTPRQSSPQLAVLERRTVLELDRFRAPLLPEERAKRRPDRLTERQRHNLDHHGYPFVLEDYRFHMTLVDTIENADHVADLLADALARENGTADLFVDALVLFRQDTLGLKFRIVQRFPLRPDSG